MNFNEKLQKLRKEQKLSQEELADRLDVTRQSVSKWESGQTYPEMDKLLAICKIFNCTLEELTNDEIKINEFNKDTKTNIVNYILDYIKRVYNYFANITFKEFMKLAITMVILGIVLRLLHYPFNELEHIIKNSLSFLKESFITRFIGGVSNFIIDIVYSFGCVFLMLYIFTIGFLDKKVITDDTAEEISETKSEVKRETIGKTAPVQSNKTEGKILSIIGMIFMFFVKLMLISFGAPFVMLVVFLSFCLAMDVMLMFQGVISIGVTLGLICAISFVSIIIEFFANIILNHKHNAKKMIAVLILSLIGGGISLGILTMEVSKYEFVDGIPESVELKTDTYNFTYSKGFYVADWYGHTSKEDNTMKNNEVKVEVVNDNFKDYFYLVYDKDNNMVNVQVTNKDSYKLRDYYNLVLDSLKEKRIYSYDDNIESRIVIYANKETLKKLEDNINNAMSSIIKEREESEIKDLNKQIDTLHNEKEDLLREVEELRNSNEELQSKIDEYKSKIEALMD